MSSFAVPTVRIKDPNLPGSFIVINESDFDPARHEKFEGETKQAALPPEEKKGATTTEPSTFPDGYRYEPGKGGYGHLYHGEVLIEGPTNGKFQGEDAARQAAIEHAQKAAGE